MDKFSLPLQDCYGMTELGGPLSLQSREDALRMNDFSTPVRGLSVKIGNGSELLIASPYRMMGYLQDGELVSPFNEDGYLDTGDLARTEESRIEITGRVKDIIIRGGINTSPARIESVLSRCEIVDEVAVVGLPHAFWGEEIVAVVVSERYDEGSILAFCRHELDSHEVPDRIVRADALPRSFIGKVLKRELVERLTRK